MTYRGQSRGLGRRSRLEHRPDEQEAQRFAALATLT